MRKILHKKIKATIMISAIAISIVAGVIISVTTLSQPASAITENELIFKALVGGMRECYKTGKMVNPLDPSKYYSYQDAIADKDSDIIVLPTLVGNSVASSKASCLQIFSGIRTGGFLGIGTTQALVGLTEINGEKLAMNYKDLGYVKETQESTESQIKCINLEYQYTAPGSNRSVTANSNKVCFPVDSNGIVNIANFNTDIIVEDPPQEEGKIELGVNYTTWSIRYKTVGAWGNDPWRELAALYEQSYDDIQQQATDNLKALDFYNEGFYSFGSVGDPFSSDDYYITATSPVTVRKSDYGASTYTAMTFRNDTPLLGAVDALRYFTGNSEAGFSDDPYKFTNDDWITLYKIYFQRMASENPQLRVTENCSTDKSSFTYAWFDGKQWCELSGVNEISGQFGWRKDTYTLKLVSFADMTKSYMNLNFSNVTQDELDPDTPAADPDQPGQTLPGLVNTNAATDACLSQAAAESMSWILCPAMGGMAAGSDGIYAGVKDLLNIDATILGNNPDRAAYKIWSYFRDFANIIFALVILAVIFSQVTGIGIDNYGIKKILPRLVVTAILVNLSYIICQLAVDLSNILGNSFSLMLSSWANTAFDYDSAGIGFLTILEGIFTGATTIGSAALPFAITAFTVGIAGWWLVVVIALIILIIVIVAVAVFYIMLAARHLIVIIAVVISPIAFICYSLPNTEKLFKSWFDILKAALLIYPICSLLCGAGQVVQSIMIEASKSEPLGIPMALVVAACPFIPFFALPALLKKSLHAVGDLGTRITGLRSGVQNLANKGNSAFRNTDTYKDAQFQTSMKRNTARLDKFKNADGTWKSDSELTGWQKRRKNLYQRRDLAYKKTDMERQNLLNGGYEASLESLTSSANKQALENEITLMANDTNNYDADTMNDALGKLLSKDSLTGAEELRMKALMQKMATSGGYGKKLLAKTAANASAGTRSSVAKFMSKNSDVTSAISSKNAAAGQYLREVNTGRAASQDFKTWKTAARTDESGNPTGMSNMQFVLSKVTTEDSDFTGQSAGVVAESLGIRETAGGGYEVIPDPDGSNQNNILSTERLTAMVNNERLMDSADSDVRRAMFYAAQQRGIAIPARYTGEDGSSMPGQSGSATPTPDAGPAPTPTPTSDAGPTPTPGPAATATATSPVTFVPASQIRPDSITGTGDIILKNGQVAPQHRSLIIDDSLPSRPRKTPPNAPTA